MGSKLVLLVVYFILVNLHLVAQEAKKNRTQFLVLPAVSYAPETTLQLGAVGFLVISRNDSVANKINRPITINPWVVYSLRNQLEVNIDLDYFFRNGDFLKISTRYYNFPDFFYGIGTESTLANQESFTNEAVYLETSFLKQFNENVFYGISGDIRNDVLFDLEEGGILLHENVTGRKGGFLWGLGPSFRFDTRDDVLYPAKGIFFEFNGLVYPEILENNYSFGSFQFDYRQYQKIRNERNILAWQILLNLTAGDQVPFYKMPKIAGSKRLRGISHYNRFVDHQAFYFQTEFRKKLFWRLGGVIFAGLGNVAPTIGDFRLNNSKFVVGLGGRFQVFKDQGMNVRIDLGFSNGGEEGLYFQVREAF